MKLPMHQVDAFTDDVFRGNPAAVVLLDTWLPDAVLQAIALENNLSETAYIVPAQDGEADFELRWFTPAVEVELCGHATLATAHVLFEQAANRHELRFSTRSGLLGVTRHGEVYTLDFPARSTERYDDLDWLRRGLGIEPVEAHASTRDVLAVFASVADVRAVTPDFRILAEAPARGIIATAPGTDGVDFVSRFFAPAFGVDEDPVTGSAHCVSTPFWSARLDKRELEARQLSARGGALRCTYLPELERVHIAGRAVSYLSGEITVP